MLKLVFLTHVSALYNISINVSSIAVTSLLLFYDNYIMLELRFLPPVSAFYNYISNANKAKKSIADFLVCIAVCCYSVVCYVIRLLTYYAAIERYCNNCICIGCCSHFNGSV